MSIKLGNSNITLKVGSSAVTAAYLGSTKVYPHDYSEEYLTFVALEAGTFRWYGYTTACTLSYSTDSGATWSEPSSAITTSTISAGDTIMWKGECIPDTWGIGHFGDYSVSAEYDVEGNIMSLIYGDNFTGQTSIPNYQNYFNGLFENGNVYNAGNLILPATTLAQGCYREMFVGAIHLTTVPELPATRLANSCYESMFKECTSLTAVPSDLLPATTLFSNCYDQMFRDCTSLVIVPELPATTLVSNCYDQMFSSCTSLVTVPSNMLPATTLAIRCYTNMFNSCTSLVTSPELPATTLADYCYYDIFRDCTSLSAITCLATDISATNCTTNWVTGVAANGTFTKAASMSSWTEGDSGIPSGWTVVDYTG